MLTIESTRRPLRDVRSLPLLSRLGLVLMLSAGALDVLVHVLSGGHGGHHGFGPEQVVHLLGVVGMVLVLSGVVAYGAHRQLRRGAAKPGGLDSHAHR